MAYEPMVIRIKRGMVMVMVMVVHVKRGMAGGQAGDGSWEAALYFTAMQSILYFNVFTSQCI